MRPLFGKACFVNSDYFQNMSSRVSAQKRLRTRRNANTDPRVWEGDPAVIPYCRQVATHGNGRNTSSCKPNARKGVMRIAWNKGPLGIKGLPLTTGQDRTRILLSAAEGLHCLSPATWVQTSRPAWVLFTAFIPETEDRDRKERFFMQQRPTSPGVSAVTIGGSATV